MRACFVIVVVLLLLVFCFCFFGVVFVVLVVFYKLEICENPASSKPFSAVSPHPPTALAPFMHQCHILVILTIFHTFPLVLVMVMCDQ